MMNGMDDLVQFLRARLDEDAAAALAVGFQYIGAHKDLTPGLMKLTIQAAAGGDPWMGDSCGEVVAPLAPHIVRYSPARVLAEVEAKRRIVALHEPVILHAGGGAAHFDTTRVCRSCEPPKQFPETAYPCATLRLLASIYDGHPDYRDTWRP